MYNRVDIYGPTRKKGKVPTKLFCGFKVHKAYVTSLTTTTILLLLIIIIITNVGQFHVNLSPLALPCSIVLSMQGGVYCLPCGGGGALAFLPT